MGIRCRSWCPGTRRPVASTAARASLGSAGLVCRSGSKTRELPITVILGSSRFRYSPPRDRLVRRDPVGLLRHRLQRDTHAVSLPRETPTVVPGQPTPKPSPSCGARRRRSATATFAGRCGTTWNDVFVSRVPRSSVGPSCPFRRERVCGDVLCEDISRRRLLGAEVDLYAVLYRGVLFVRGATRHAVAGDGQFGVVRFEFQEAIEEWRGVPVEDLGE